MRIRAPLPPLTSSRRRFVDRAAAAHLLIIVVWAAVATLAPAAPALAAQVRIPLTIDYVTLREAIRRKLYTAPGGRAPLWNGIDDCQFLYAENPRFSGTGSPSTVKLETDTSLGLGVGLAGNCLNAVQWSGIVEAIGTPYIAPGLQLKFHFTDLNLYNAQHQKSEVVSQGFDTIKSYLVPRLNDFSYDLKPAVQQLSVLAGDASDPEVAQRVRAAIASLTAEPNITALDEGIRVTLVMTVPDLPVSIRGGSGGPAAALTPAELKAFQTTLDQWDAFLVFTVKQLGDAVGDQQFRDELLKILLDSRYRLVQALNNPEQNAEPDPVRILFLDEWRQLHDAVRSAAQRGMLGAHALEFLSFISAGDALFALDQAAPALGMRISAQDLRRLAHIMAPQAAGDPLQFNYGEDRDLKKLFDVHEPPSTHGPIKEEDIPGSSSSPAPSAPSPSHPHASSLGAVFFATLKFFSPRDASAADVDYLVPLQNVAARLYRLVVNEDNADHYRNDMSQLLELSAARQIGNGEVEANNSQMYLILVKSTAWQESCWRQFVMVGSEMRWLESSTGDIGLMQVNKHVWRGFYDIERLEWDVLYNAGAGCDVLARMVRYCAASQFKYDPVPIAGHLARSAYAAYNGGPSSCDRWRRRESKQHALVDSQFLEKYSAVESGTQIDILSCARDWSHPTVH